MPPVHLTARKVEALKKKAAKDDEAVVRWDAKLKGFGCRVSPKGQVSWLVQKWRGDRTKGQQRIVIEGRSLDEARKEAEVRIGEFNRGNDLVSRKAKARQQKLALLQSPKLREAVELYLRRSAKPGSYWQEVKRRLEREVIEVIGGDTRVLEITKADVRALIEAKQDKGHHSSARYTFAVLRPFLKWCVERDLIPASPLEDLATPEPAEARDRILSDDEIKAFWKATEADRLFGPFHRLLLLTAQRREEVGAMRWPEIDLDAATWIIPKERTKNSKEHLVHLSTHAVAILKAI